MLSINILFVFISLILTPGHAVAQLTSPVDIVGIALFSSQEEALNAIEKLEPKTTIEQLYKGAITAGGFKSPEYIFGFEGRSSSTTSRNRIRGTFSTKNGTLIMFDRTVSYEKDHQPTLEAVMKDLIDKYGEPIYNTLGFVTWGDAKNFEITGSTIINIINNVMYSYGQGIYREQIPLHSKSGTFLSAQISYKNGLVSSVQYGFCNLEGITESYNNIQEVVKVGLENKINIDKSKANNVKPNL